MHKQHIEQVADDFNFDLQQMAYLTDTLFTERTAFGPKSTNGYREPDGYRYLWPGTYGSTDR